MASLFQFFEETARIWMQSLGVTFSEVRKDIYYDGHEREDNVQHQNGLILRFFEWEDFENNIPGYSKRANHYVYFNREDAKKMFVLSNSDLEKYAVPNCEDKYEFHVDDWDIDRGKFGPMGGTLSSS